MTLDFASFVLGQATTLVAVLVGVTITYRMLRGKPPTSPAARIHSPSNGEPEKPPRLSKL